VVTAADLIYPSEIEIANPELHIATLDSPDARLDMELNRRARAWATCRRTSGIRAPRRGAVTRFSRRFGASITPLSARVGARTDLIAWDRRSDGRHDHSDRCPGPVGDILIDQFALFQEVAAEKRRPTSRVSALVRCRPRIFDIQYGGASMSARILSGSLQVGHLA